ncbi:MAG: tyrosine-type recombinase/integrase [Solidesulfovibrio sp.]
MPPYPDLTKIKDAASPHLVWAIEVPWDLGVRTGESELLALTWHDIDWEDSSIKVYATTAKTTRVIPIAPEFLERLKTMRQKAQTGYIIEYQGKPLRKFRRSLKTAAEKAGLTYPVVMYDIRHLFATTLLREGGDVAAVRKLMAMPASKGPSTSTTTCSAARNGGPLPSYRACVGQRRFWS